MKKLPIQSKSHPGTYALLKDDDYTRLCQLPWILGIVPPNNIPIAITNVNGQCVPMDDFIDDPPGVSNPMGHYIRMDPFEGWQ